MWERQGGGWWGFGDRDGVREGRRERETGVPVGWVWLEGKKVTGELIYLLMCSGPDAVLFAARIGVRNLCSRSYNLCSLYKIQRWDVGA